MFPEYMKISQKFVSAGSAINLDLPAIPDHFRIINLNCASGEIFEVEWFKAFGDGKDIITRMILDNGTGTLKSKEYRSTGGFINVYDSNSWGAGSYTDKDNYTPATQTKHQGVTIHADFSDDNDVLLFEAEFFVDYSAGTDLS